MTSLTLPPNGHRCGGTLIDENHVLTSAHCVTDTAYSWQDLILIFGTNNLGIKKQYNRNRLDLSILQFIVHPKYDPEYMYYDVAIIQLNETIEFNEHIRPVCLPTSPAG